MGDTLIFLNYKICVSKSISKVNDRLSYVAFTNMLIITIYKIYKLHQVTIVYSVTWYMKETRKNNITMTMPRIKHYKENKRIRISTRIRHHARPDGDRYKLN